ncbi:hypothetical protein [Okeania sp. SIO1I7]|nr:hypothetical protein [Okeania sp. SIO1I7]
MRPRVGDRRKWSDPATTPPRLCNADSCEGMRTPVRKNSLIDN